MSPKWKATIAAVTAGYVVAMSPIFVGGGWTDRTKALVGFAGVAIVLIAGRPLICHERSPIGLLSTPSAPRQGQMRTHPAQQNTTTDSEQELFDGLPPFGMEDDATAPDVPEGVDPDTGEVLGDRVALLEQRLDQLGTVVADQSTLMATGLANLRREVARITTLRQVDDAA